MVLFVRLFDLRVFGFVCFHFLLVSGKGCGLCHSLDFSLTLFCAMETVYGGMLYNQTLGGLRRVRLAQLVVRCLLSGILRAFLQYLLTFSISEKCINTVFFFFLLLLWNILSEIFV